MAFSTSRLPSCEFVCSLRASGNSIKHTYTGTLFSWLHSYGAQTANAGGAEGSESVLLCSARSWVWHQLPQDHLLADRVCSYSTSDSCSISEDMWMQFMLLNLTWSLLKVSLPRLWPDSWKDTFHGRLAGTGVTWHSGFYTLACKWSYCTGRGGG